MSESTSREVFAGSTVEIDNSGDYLVNTTEALNGDVRFQLAPGRALVVEIAGEPVFQVSQEGGSVRIDLGGSASERVVLGDKLKALLNAFFENYNTHMHNDGTSGAPTSTPLRPFVDEMTDEDLSSVARTK